MSLTTSALQQRIRELEALVKLLTDNLADIQAATDNSLVTVEEVLNG